MGLKKGVVGGALHTKAEITSPLPPREDPQDCWSSERSIMRLNDDGIDLGMQEAGMLEYDRLDFDGKAFVSSGPVVDPSVCSKVIDTVLSISKSSGYGAYVFAKQTLSVNDHSSLEKVVSPITQAVVSAVNDLYCEDGKTDFEFTKVNEPHVVVYDASVEDIEGYRRVGFHTDSSDITFIVALSRKDVDYTGGGTVIESFGPSPITLSVGECLIFEGGNERHKGEEITKGMRVLLVGFMKRKKASKKHKSKMVKRIVGNAFLGN